MKAVARAALAPANPSGKDRAVAASARKTETEARQEINNLSKEELMQAKKAPESRIEDDTENPEPNQKKTNIINNYSPDSGPEIRGSKLDISI